MSNPSIPRKAAFHALRSRPREVAFQVLYQDDLNPGLDAAITDAFLQEQLNARALFHLGAPALPDPDGDLDDEPSPAADDQQLSGLGPAELLAMAVELLDRVSPEKLAELSAEQLAQLLRNDAVAFARSLVAGVRQRQAELDELLEAAAEHWHLGRMAATDRNVLRLGAYELLYSDTPERVAVDEAVELAKRFGGKQSGQFVNGILDRLMQQKAKQ